MEGYFGLSSILKESVKETQLLFKKKISCRDLAIWARGKFVVKFHQHCIGFLVLIWINMMCYLYK